MEYKNAENPTPVETGYMEEFDLLPNYLALYAAIKHGLTAEKAFLLIGYHGMFSYGESK
ncbi:MAG: hypothetical protein PHO72_02395 [Sphaerochaeta sp.]|nr:hypothetical protein [Sphaerochaeta sp.]